MALRLAGFALSALATIFSVSSVWAEETVDDVAAGRAEYKASCMVCHGENGTGDGELAQFLTIKPADLTQLTKANNGQYPFLKIFQTIDGRAVARGHGVAMPVWGTRYMAESDAKGVEPYRSYTAEAFVRARILELTYYIQTLQK